MTTPLLLGDDHETLIADELIATVSASDNTGTPKALASAKNKINSRGNAKLL